MTVTVRPARKNHQSLSACGDFEQGHPQDWMMAECRKQVAEMAMFIRAIYFGPGAAT